MTTLSDAIAREMMDTIERERRINLDDLRLAAERVLQRSTPPTLGRIGGFDRARGRDYTGVWFNEASMFPPPPDVHADTQVVMSANEVLCRADMIRAEADKIVNPPVFVAEPVSRGGFVCYTSERPVTIGPGTYALKFAAGETDKAVLVKVDEADDGCFLGKAWGSDWMVS